MVKKEEYINCLYHLLNLPLEIIERIIYFLYTYQFNTPLELRQALENYPDSVKRYGECSGLGCNPDYRYESAIC